MLNSPEVITKVTDKLEFFRHMSEADHTLVPKFWTDAESIPDSAFPVVCRTVLNGHSGRGIVIAQTRDELVYAPLYVKYMKKQTEYRVHVGRQVGNPNLIETIAIQRKARSRSVPQSQVNWEVRTHENGFVFARQNVTPPTRVTDAARKALELTGLDFGAVDVIDNENKGKAYVLEINSAPGMEGQTVDDYAKYFTSIIPKARVNQNEDGTWHVESPYLDKFGRRQYTVEDCETWEEAQQLVTA
jgi:glutathione synthase/RimK-type ligase-like ATP-grasp enzyme